MYSRAKYALSPVRLTHANALQTLIENRTIYSFEQCELNIFETYQKAEHVNLTFDDVVLTSMIRGKKVMKMDAQPFDYLPGESVIVAPGKTMEIDFPEAEDENPTQCIALELSSDIIHKTLNLLNEEYQKPDGCGHWEIDNSMYHLFNSMEFMQTINRIIAVSQNEKGQTKDLIVDLTIREMLIRLMQTQARKLLYANCKGLELNNPLAYAINYIHDNLHTKISLNKVAQKACMSRANFFKKFREITGETPSQYILKGRIKLAMDILKRKNTSVSDACFGAGFENASHFATAFKKEVGISPIHYKKSIL